MGSLHVVIDPLARHPDAGSVIVDSDTSYLAARKKIYAFLETAADGELVVVVRRRALVGRFDDLRESPGVTFEERNPVTELAQRLGAPLPAGLSEQDIDTLGLEQLAALHPPDAGECVQEWIIRHQLGRPWQGADAPSSAEDLSEAVSGLASAELRSPWLTNRVAETIARWKQAGEWRAIWAYLEDDPALRAQALTAYASVRHYPRPKRKEWLGEYWAASEIDAFEEADEAAAALGRVKPPERLRPDIEQQISAYLAERFTLGADPDKIVAYVTGAVATEVPVLFAHLRMTPELVTPRVVNAIEAVASPEQASVIAQLRRLLPVASPEPVDADWTAADVDGIRRWFSDHYLPWYRAVRRRRERSPDHETVCRSFAAWLQRAYPELLRDPRHTILGVHDRIAELVAGGRPVIWLIVDALGAEWNDVMIQLGRTLGMEPTDCHSVLTLLPTTTKVAKPALVSGVPRSLDETASASSLADYQRLASRLAWTALGGVDLGAEWKDGQLSEFVGRKSNSVWIYLINQLDEAVAHDLMAFADRARRVEMICTEILKAAQQAQETAQLRFGRRPAVVISADHGFTSPAEGAILEGPPEQGALESDRCVRYGADQAASARDGWVVLEPPADYGLVDRYALAYGNRFVGNTSPMRATHGGANPEEVLVPYLEFDGAPAALQAPRVRIAGRLRAGEETQSCTIAVMNPNLQQLVDVRVESRYLAEAVQVGGLASMDEVERPASLQGGPHPEGVLPVPVTVRYRTASTSDEATPVEVLATVARALQSEAPTKDAFEEMFRD
jgi:hypothetical protein